MKKLVIILSAFFLMAAFVTADTWKVDKAHSQIGFSITNLGISDITGTFNDFDVTITSSKPDFSDAAVQMTAKVSSIDTRIEARDKHLQAPDFFDAEKYPNIEFKSTGITTTSKNLYKLTGNLTFHGVTKEVNMNLLFRGITEHPMTKAKVAGFQLTGEINRSDFNFASAYPPPMLSEKVSIKADGQFGRTK